jgi:hypothetical protein
MWNRTRNEWHMIGWSEAMSAAADSESFMRECECDE